MPSSSLHLSPYPTHTFILHFFFFLMIRRPPRSTLFPHDALPICLSLPEAHRAYLGRRGRASHGCRRAPRGESRGGRSTKGRSEEHTSELQSRLHLVCRLLLEKKNERARPRSERQTRRLHRLLRRA